MFKKLLMLVALLLPAAFSHAHEMSYQAGQLQIKAPWSLELPPNAPTVAAYFVIHNAGQTPDRLLSVQSPVAGSAQLHEHQHVDGLMKMQQVPEVDIAPGQDAIFAPMAYHVMLLDLKDRSQLVQGQHFPLTLQFEKAGDVTVQVQVLKQAPNHEMK
ncbi:copper chaperone PCu(A)C [Pseudomonas sp. Pseusp122]|uniref:copper chaperone PCu(A)C n=1 Tax=unclassified Pseudomonas TaxID=196821 RepID=UPI0039A58D61